MINTSLPFRCGLRIPNRFMLAPLTNSQSHEDGRITNDEHHWLYMRAKGGFGIVMTCASHVQAIGKGFPGQLGIWSDQHIEGHQRLTAAIRAEGSLSMIQLHHAGLRTPQDLVEAQIVSPSSLEKYSSRGLSTAEVEQLRDDFIAAALRAQKSGYDGVEVHGAHGYILTQFLSPDYNFRNDHYGGSLANRSRLLFEIVEGIRAACGQKFLLAVRLSPERFGMQLDEVKTVTQQLIDSEMVDFMDISLWDCFKHPEEEEHQDRPLLQHFVDLNWNNTRFTVAGKIRHGRDVQSIINQGVDFVTIGKSAILHHDFPKQVIANPDFECIANPVSEAYLQQEGLGPAFIAYMKRWEGFVG